MAKAAGGESTKAILKDEELKKFLEGLKTKLTDVTPYLKLAYSTFGYRDIISHFENESGPDGKWKPRSKATQMAYAIRGKTNAMYNPSNKLLQLSGMLRQSITESSYKNIDRLSVGIFSNKEYSGVHDLGSNKMPQRQFMWFSNGAMSNMVTLLLNKLIEDKAM